METMDPMVRRGIYLRIKKMYFDPVIWKTSLVGTSFILDIY